MAPRPSGEVVQGPGPTYSGPLPTSCIVAESCHPQRRPGPVEGGRAVVSSGGGQGTQTEAALGGGSRTASRQLRLGWRCCWEDLKCQARELDFI